MDIALECAACGAFIAGGRDACQSLFDHYNGLALSDVALGRAHRILVDAYCMQHLEPYCRSAKSYAAHLAGLCWAMRYGGGPDGYAAIQRWLNTASNLNKPPVLDMLGELTVTHIRGATGPSEHARRVHEWASDVWAAYSSQHELAEQWIVLAFAAAKAPRTRYR